MSAKFHRLTICSVDQLTDDAVAIRFAVPDDLSDEFTFLPGQYLTLRAVVDDEELRRSYSICATPQDGLRVGVKHVPGGRFSSFAQNLKTGETLDVMTPEGRFVCNTEVDKERQFIMIAAGSGITPILSIMQTVLENEPDSRVTLIYGNQRASSIMFRTEIDDLKDRFLERFQVYHVLSREAQDIELFSGRIDADRIRSMTEKGLVQPDTADGIYLCGPAAMSLELSDHLKSSGIDGSKIHTELFEAPDDIKPVKIEDATLDVVEKGVGIEVVLDGTRRSFALTDASDTVLQAALRSGLDLPFSCKGGMCATCRCKVIDGEASMDRNYSLDEWELEAGFVLACQSRPKSERLVLDFDAA